MSFKMFRAYDTGQSHVLDTWQIRDCGTETAPLQGKNSRGNPIDEFRAVQIWSIPHGVNMPQNQLVMRNITYADGPPNPAKLISFDVGQRDTYGAYFMNFLDADGSLTRRRADTSACRPTWVGSAHTIRAVSEGYQDTASNLWFKLTGLDDGGARGSASSGDARCDLMATVEYPMWACDRGSISVAAILVVPNDREQTTARTKQVWGRVQHWGDASTDGPPLSGDHQVVGPHDHARRGGWFLQYHSAADDASSWSSPKRLEIRAQQLEDGSVLVLALAYPAGTTFGIRRKVSSSNRGWLPYTTAPSVAAIRQDSGPSQYYFDGTYLYLRMADVDAGGFGEDGLYVPLHNPAYDLLEITATWAGATGCGSADWCRAATQDAPAASVGDIAGSSAQIPCAMSDGPYWPIRSLPGGGAPPNLHPPSPPCPHLPPPLPLSPPSPLAEPYPPAPPPSVSFHEGPTLTLTSSATTAAMIMHQDAVVMSLQPGATDVNVHLPLRRSDDATTAAMDASTPIASITLKGSSPKLIFADAEGGFVAMFTKPLGRNELHFNSSRGQAARLLVRGADARLSCTGSASSTYASGANSSAAASSASVLRLSPSSGGLTQIVFADDESLAAANKQEVSLMISATGGILYVAGRLIVHGVDVLESCDV